MIINFASSLDGRISAKDGKQFKFSNLEDMSRVHRMRAEADIIVVGRNTVEMDDPKLVVNDKYFHSERIPDVGILDTMLLVNNKAKLFDYRRNVIIFCGSSAPERRFEGEGESKVMVKRSPELRPTARFVTEELGSLGYRRVMVEGGRSVITSFILEDVWDEISIFYSPVLMGDDGVPMLGRIPELIRFEGVEVGGLGNGFLVKIKKRLNAR
ncbi:MAG: RibD family protein [Thermoplasmata archaeon]